MNCDVASNKKIMFATVDMSGGGAERVISILANRMVSRGVEVAILMTAGDTVSYELNPEINILSAGGKSGGSNIARIKRIKTIRDYLKKYRDYTVVAFGPSPSFFTWIASIGLGMDFNVSERNDPAACPHPKLRNFIYNRARVMVCQTEDALEAFPKHLKSKGVVIPNPVRNDLPKPIEPDHRPHTVVAVGRLQPQKNYELMLEAFAQFHAKYQDYTLHVYGKGELLQALTEKSQQLQISEFVRWEGFHTDVLDLINGAGMYVLSSDYEGISNALIEAMALGLPCISTDCPIGGSRMCISDGDNGLLVPCNDASALSEAMCRIAEDETFASELSKKAMLIRSKYDENAIVDSWMNVL